MKRKLLIASLSAMACLTVSSCDMISGFFPNPGLTEKEARTFTQDAEKSTRNHLATVANGDTYYLDVTASASANYDITLKNSSTYNSKVEESRKYGSVEGGAIAHLQLDLASIRNDKLGTSNVNASGNAVLISNLVEGRDTYTEKFDGSMLIYGDKSSLTLNVKEGEYTNNQVTSLNNDEEKMLADVINEAVVAPSKQKFDMSVITGAAESMYIDWTWYDEFEGKTNQFKDKEITSAEYLDYVDSKFFGDVLENDLDDQSYALIVKVLDKQESILPEYFFTYTKESNDAGTILHGVFNYELWKLALQAAVVEIAAEEVENLEDLMDDIEELTTLYMPTKFVWEYDLAVDTNGVISGYQLHLDVEGTYKAENEWIYGETTYVDTQEFIYKASTTIKFDFRVANTPKA